MPPAGPRQVEQALNITDEVIRFLITRPDLKAAAKAEALKAEKAAKQAARGSNADDEPEQKESTIKK